MREGMKEQTLLTGLGEGVHAGFFPCVLSLNFHSNWVRKLRL